MAGATTIEMIAMTEAVTCRDAKLYVKINGAWKELKEMKTYPQVGEGDLSKLDATSLSDTVKTYIKDIPDMPDLQFTFNAMPTDSADSNLDIVMNTMNINEAYDWKLEIPLLKVQMTIRADWTYNISAGGVSTVQELVISLAGRTKMIFDDLDATYAISYDANTGTGTMTDTNSPYANGSLVTVMDNSFTKAGKTFKYWATSSDGSGEIYHPGQKFTIHGNTVLYAVWSD